MNKPCRVLWKRTFNHLSVVFTINNGELIRKWGLKEVIFFPKTIPPDAVKEFYRALPDVLDKYRNVPVTPSNLILEAVDNAASRNSSQPQLHSEIKKLKRFVKQLSFVHPPAHSLNLSG